MKKYGTLLIIIAGIFWGSMGLFVRYLSSFGFSSIQIAALRLSVAAVIFSLILLIKEPKGFKINIRDIFLFLGLGLCSILFFTVCYFTSIQLMSMSTAAILLYTSPIWVMLMAVIIFKERITKAKMIALILSFAGCICVSGLGSGSVTWLGILIGLGSGIGYGLYSILGRIALKKYSPYVVTTYTFIIAAMGAIIICNPIDVAEKFSAANNAGFLIFFIFITGLVTAVIPFMCYTLGLQNTEAGKAAILATVEPLVATVIGAVVYHEEITLLSTAGIICILLAVVILNIKRKSLHKNQNI